MALLLASVFLIQKPDRPQMMQTTHRIDMVTELQNDRWTSGAGIGIAVAIVPDANPSGED